MLGIVQARLHLDRAHLGIELWLDRRQLGLEYAALEGVDPDLHRLADREVGARLLRQGEVDIEIVEIGQGDDRRAGVEELADLDLAHAELAGEGRAHQLLGDDRLGVGDARLGDGEVALVLIDGLLGGILLVGELAVAAEGDLRQAGLGLEGREIGLLRLVVELHQRIAGLHLGARFEHDLHDPAAELGRDRHLVHGAHAADAVEIARHGRGRDGDGRDRRGRLGRRDESRDHALFALLEEIEARPESPAITASHDDETQDQRATDSTSAAGRSRALPKGPRA